MTTVPVAERAHRRWRPSTVDVAIALVVLVVEIGVTLVASSHQDTRRGFDALGALLLASGALALVWRRRQPVAVLGVAFATTLTYVVVGFPQGPIYFSLIVAFVTTVLSGHRRLAWATIVVGWVSFLWLGVVIGTRDTPSLAAALGLASWLLVLATTTDIVRMRRERSAEAARLRAEEQRVRASEERLRIARELHDVVAHNLSLINVQAGSALHLIHEHPENAEGALTAIKQASKDALDELRSLLDVLRDGAEVAPRVPTPTLADLDGLVERTVAAGIPVEVRVDGDRRPLPAPVETAAYRVAQEALTNVVRHAGPAHTVVRLSYRADALVVQVDDDGRGPGPNGGAPAGKGITGMQERVHALGGELETGARGATGFRVRARIPVGGDR
jgi:signal transduction histidine kinase